jgi:hypothetical protein
MKFFIQGSEMDQNEAIVLAVEYILKDGCSDITVEDLELKLIDKFKTQFIKDIQSKLKKGSIEEMGFLPPQYILTPKNRYVFDYRKAAILNPSCVAKFLAIVLQYADIVESARVPVSENIVFSYRYKPSHEGLFNKQIGYSEWLAETKRLASSGDYQYIVECDIAAFYDRVNIHRIESTLTSIGVDNHLVKLTNNLLLNWSNKDSYGIPVGNIASRIIAEAALIDIDQYLISEKIVFTRYVDDFRLFAPDLITAQSWMNKLTTRLFRDGLMLNIGKTKIKTIKNEESSEKPSLAEDNAESVLQVITRLTGGYNRIVRKFIMPAKERHKEFLKINVQEELELIKQNQEIVVFEGIQKIVIAALVQKKYQALIEIARVCSIYLYGLDYFIDMLIKNETFIPGEQRDQIADFYVYLIESDNLYSFEWHCASIAKLLSREAYFRKEALIHLFKSPSKDVTTYASMIALDGLHKKLTRTDFKTIREYFSRSDEWEKRRLLFLSDALPLGERKPWAKSVRSQIQNDILGTCLCSEIIKGHEFS